MTTGVRWGSFLFDEWDGFTVSIDPEKLRGPDLEHVATAADLFPLIVEPAPGKSVSLGKVVGWMIEIRAVQGMRGVPAGSLRRILRAAGVDVLPDPSDPHGSFRLVHGFRLRGDFR